MSLSVAGPAFTCSSDTAGRPVPDIVVGFQKLLTVMNWSRTQVRPLSLSLCLLTTHRDGSSALRVPSVRLVASGCACRLRAALQSPASLQTRPTPLLPVGRMDEQAQAANPKSTGGVTADQSTRRCNEKSETARKILSEGPPSQLRGLP